MSTHSNSNIELDESDLETIREDFRNAEYTKLKLAASSIRMFTILGALLSICFIAINSGQAFWALKTLSGLASDSLLNEFITGFIAIGLILASKVIGVRLGMTDGGLKALGVFLLISLMIFSITTSALHLSFNLVGGSDRSLHQSTEYKLALSDYQVAADAYQQVLNSAKIADEKGKVSDAGWIRGRHLPPLKEDLDNARNRLDSVKVNGAGSESKVLTTVASWFNLTSDEFSVRFSILTVMLMELSSLFLSFQTGASIRKAMSGKKPQAHQDRASVEKLFGEAA